MCLNVPMTTMTTIPRAKSLCDLEKMLPDEAVEVWDGLADEVVELCCVDVALILLLLPRLIEAVLLEAEVDVVGASVALLVAAEAEEEVASGEELAVSKVEEETLRVGVERVVAVVVLAAVDEAVELVAELDDSVAVTAATTGVATVGTTAAGVLTETAVALAFTTAGTLTTTPAPAPRTAVGLAMAWRTSRSRLQRLWPAIS